MFETKAANAKLKMKLALRSPPSTGRRSSSNVAPNGFASESLNGSWFQQVFWAGTRGQKEADDYAGEREDARRECRRRIAKRQ